MSNSDLDVARWVINTEMQGLQAINDWLGSDFSKAIDILHAVQGRVILSGMGKSGHIARKIASTMASTGTPAIFVHPGEASHGDLGMITKSDAVILLSNSGETAELKDIINYCGRFNIPLIAIVRRKGSVLTTASDVAMVLPEVPEACKVNAPTTSTTMMLVLGDAIAVSLQERRGFSGDDFSIFHPGGKLGSAFIKIENLMHTGDRLPLVSLGTIMTEALTIMTDKALGCVGVIDDLGNLSGIITDGDLRRHMSVDIRKLAVEDVMTKNPLVISKEDLASRALSLMEGKAITNLFVIKDNKPIGIVHIHDILRAGVI